MKRTITPLFLALASATLANVKIPETTPDVNAATLYAKGEGAYAVVSDAREARLYVGGDNGEALSVVDASAIRGEIHNTLPSDSLYFDLSSSVEQTSNDSFVWTDTKANYAAGKSWLRVIAKDGGKIDSLKFGCTVNASGTGVGATVNVAAIEDGNAYRINLAWTDNATSATIAITNVVAYRIDPSTKGNRTDAVRNRYRITDSRGTFDLGTVREAVYKEIDRTSGARWSQWSASNLVNLAGHPLAFDAAKKIFMRYYDGVFGLNVGGARIVEVTTDDDSDKYANATAITFTGIDSTMSDDPTHVKLSFSITHTGSIIESDIVVLRCEELGKSDGTFSQISRTIVSATATSTGTDYVVLVDKDADADKAFYKIAYGGLSATATLNFNADAVFNKAVTVNGAFSAGAPGQRVAAATVADGALALTLDAATSIYQATLDADLTALTVTAAFADESDAYARTWEIVLDASACASDIAPTWPEDWKWLNDGASVAAGTHGLFAVRRMPDGTVLASKQGEY